MAEESETTPERLNSVSEEATASSLAPNESFFAEKQAWAGRSFGFIKAVLYNKFTDGIISDADYDMAITNLEKIWSLVK